MAAKRLQQDMEQQQQQAGAPGAAPATGPAAPAAPAALAPNGAGGSAAGGAGQAVTGTPVAVSPASAPAVGQPSESPAASAPAGAQGTPAAQSAGTTPAAAAAPAGDEEDAPLDEAEKLRLAEYEASGSRVACGLSLYQLSVSSLFFPGQPAHRLAAAWLVAHVCGHGERRAPQPSKSIHLCCPACTHLPPTGFLVLSCFALQELIEAAKQQLGFPFREDGPPLGYEFDDIPLGLPPGGVPAAGLSTGSSGGGGRKRKANALASGLASPPFKDNDEDDPDFIMAGSECCLPCHAAALPSCRPVLQFSEDRAQGSANHGPGQPAASGRAGHGTAKGSR